MAHTASTGKKPPVPVFVALTVVIFFSTLSAADSVGFVPYYIDGTTPASERVALSDLPELGPQANAQNAAPAAIPTALPTRIVIPSAGVDVPVMNPPTRDIDVLYKLLADGAARHMDAAKLGENGNVIIFGHSSRLPTRNPMLSAFNKIPDLKAGDVITLVGDDGKSYLYSVIDVKRANVNDPEAAIDLSPWQGKKLTIVTCDLATGKTARFVLTAEFVGVVE